MALIIDPDLLAQGVEVTITTASKTIGLNIAGDLSNDGVTLKCLYSFLKEAWKTDAALIKFPFPMIPITDEQFEFVQGWDMANNASRYLIRTAGWAVRNTAGVATQMWAGIKTLGSVRSTDTGVAALTINVVALAKTFTRTTGSFVTDGFVAGQRVVTSGFTNAGNNGTKIISSVTATVMTMTVDTGLVNETGNNDERVDGKAQVYFIQGENEVQSVDLGNIAATHTYNLNWGGFATTSLTFSADMSVAIKNALEALPVIAVDDLIVTKDAGVQVYRVVFGGTLGATDVSLISITNPVTFTPGTVTTLRTGTNQATATTVDFQLTGPVNQAIQIYLDADGDGITAETTDYDYRGFLRLFVREWGDTYATASLATLGLSAMTYQGYAFPLATATDIKVAVALEADAGLAPYNDINITYYAGTGFTVHADSTKYPADSVVQDANGRWFRTPGGGTSGTDNVLSDGSDLGILDWVAFAGERQIPGVGYFPFSVAIDGNVDNTGSNALAEAIYTRIQYQLDQPGDIDAGAGTRNGAVAELLLGFVGDTLITTRGVWIDDYNSLDVNRLTFTDATGVARNFLFTASLTLNFGANLVADAAAIYRVFFTNDDPPGANAGADYGTSAAVIVNDASSVAMSGNVSAQTSVTHTFAYDSNVQRGASTAGTNAPVTVVAIGLSTGQFVVATGTIARSTTNSVSLVAPLERNYLNP